MVIGVFGVNGELLVASGDRYESNHSRSSMTLLLVKKKNPTVPGKGKWADQGAAAVRVLHCSV